MSSTRLCTSDGSAFVIDLAHRVVRDKVVKAMAESSFVVLKNAAGKRYAINPEQVTALEELACSDSGQEPA